MRGSMREMEASTGVTTSLDTEKAIAHHHPHHHHHDSTSSSPSPLPTEKGGVISHDPQFAGGHVDFSHMDEKRILRKIDLRLLPMLSLLYLLAFLDRGNIGNAKIEGMLKDLHMTGPQYNWVVSCDQDNNFPDRYFMG